MTAFSMHTEISIEIYAAHPKGVSGTGATTINDTYSTGELPPFLGKGLVFRPDAEPEAWQVASGTNLATLTIPTTVTVDTNDRVFTAHEVRVGNKIGIKGVDPCLENAPTITDTLPTLLAGVTDSSPVSFTIVNPRLQRWFSSDFTSTNGAVSIARVSSNTRTNVWRGLITRISTQDVKTTISARPEMKKLDQKADFGFRDELFGWDVTDHKIPIISARLIPYSVRVHEQAPQVVSPYPDWRVEYAAFLSDFQGTPSGP